MTSVVEGAEQLEICRNNSETFAARNAKWRSHSGKHSGTFLEHKACTYHRIWRSHSWACMLPSGSLHNRQPLEQLEYPFIQMSVWRGEQMQVYAHVEYCPAVKQNALFIHSTTRMNLRGSGLCERARFRASLTCVISLYDITEKTELEWWRPDQQLLGFGDHGGTSLGLWDYFVSWSQLHKCMHVVDFIELGAKKII